MSQLAKELITEAKAENLKTLDLGLCGLTDLDAEVPELFELTNLEELILGDYNQIWTDNERRFVISKNHKNRIDSNQIQCFPKKIENLTKLRKIVCDGLPEINWGISDLSPLKSLENLTELYLSYNSIEYLSALSNFSKLERLDLEGNKISDLSGLAECRNLRCLSLKLNILTDVSALEHLTNLISLLVNKNSISSLNPFCRLENLIYLDISKNKIARLENLDKLLSLIWLNLSNNQISKIENLDNLRDLQELDISGNQLIRIENLNSLCNLKTLNISNNKITKVSGLNKLQTLESLDISRNNIKSLNYFRNKRKFRTLNISYNPIRDLSPLKEWILDGVPVNKHSANEGIVIHGCPLTTPSEKVLSLGPRGIKAYFEDLKKGKTKDTELKMIVLGNGCAGKTALVRRLVHNKYEEIDLITGRTHGIIIEHYHVAKSNIMLHIWDFGGQEIYHSTHRLFLTDNTLYLLLWTTKFEDDLTENFFPPTYWLDYISEISTNSVVIMIPSKYDVLGNYSLPEFNDIQDFFKKKNLDLYQADALSSKFDWGIKTLRAQIAELAKLILKKHKDEMPESWIMARDQIYKHWFGKHRIATLTDFSELVADLDLSDELSVLKYLNVSGVIFWKEKYLNDKIIVDQQYFLDVVYEVFKHRRIKKSGIFSWEDACEFWQKDKEGTEFSDNDRQLFLDFMHSCEIMFKTQNKEGALQFIIPQLLLEEPYYWRNKSGEHLLKLTYPFLHRNIIERFIVRTARLAEKDKTWWRNGIYIVDDEGNEAYIVANKPHDLDYRNQSITIKACGPSCMKLMAKIRNEFAKLSRFDKVEQEVSIDGGMNWVSINNIKTYNQRDEKFIYSNEGRKVEISPLLVFLDEETILSKTTDNNHLNMDKQQIQTLIAQGKIKEALSLLLQTDSEIINLQSRLSRLEKQDRIGTISTADANLERNRIRNALLEWLDINNTENDLIEPVNKVVVNSATQKAVLFICSSPSDANALNFGDELKKIEDALESSSNIDKYKIEIKTAVQFDQLPRLLSRFQPNVLHLSMHSSLEQGGLLFQHKDGKSHPISPESFCEMLDYGLKNPLDLLVLSACNSQNHARLIDKAAKHVIGMNDFISDEALAYYFSQFYKIYFDQEDVARSHKTAITNLKANNRIEDHLYYSQVPYIQK